MKYLSQSTENGNACGLSGVPRLAASAFRSAPRDCPYQSRLPSSRVGPCHSLRMMSASACVNVPQSPADVPMSAFGSYVHRFGSSMTPSLTPSMASHAATAAVVAAASLHDAIGFDAVFICIEPQSDCIIRFVQLIA